MRSASEVRAAVEGHFGPGLETAAKGPFTYRTGAARFDEAAPGRLRQYRPTREAAAELFVASFQDDHDHQKGQTLMWRSVPVLRTAPNGQFAFSAKYRFE